MDIELVLLLYNRPEHAKRVLEGIRSNKIPRVRAYLDYSDDPTVQENQARILELIDGFSGLEIDLVRRTEKLGLARSVRTSLDEAFTRADAAVLLEDDCVLRPGAWAFFEEGLNALRDNPRIRSLCGYLFPRCSFVFDSREDIMMVHRFSTWGWATWADRWEQYTTDLRTLVRQFEDTGMRIENFAEDIAVLCKSPRYLDGEVDIWSVPWILLHFLTNSFAVYPRESVVENIGNDGTGANCEDTEVFRQVTWDQGRNTYQWSGFRYYIENEEMLREFMAEHGLKTYPSP